MPDFWELLLIVIIVLFLFRPKTVHEIARSLGRLVYEYKRGKSESKQDFSTEKTSEIMRIARELGIDTEGLSKEEVYERVLKTIKEDEN